MHKVGFLSFTLSFWAFFSLFCVFSVPEERRPLGTSKNLPWILHLPPRIVPLPSRLVGRTQCCTNQRIALAHRAGPWQARPETLGFTGAKVIGKGGSIPLPPGKRIFFPQFT